VAFTVDEADLEACLERLRAAGVPAFPVVINHDDSETGVARKLHPGVFVRSVYFTDPNGIMMELAAFTRAFGPEDVRHAPARATVDA
jgi:catechol 2,3-dioxygenase-like lactoylglutathione lyase family enzyme